MTQFEKGKILVTGGAGFIGSATIWELNRWGITDILVADFLENDEKFKNLLSLSFDDYVEADSLLEIISESSKSLDDIKTILHFGACSSTTESDAQYLIHNNYEYTKTLAHWALENDIKFVYASSAATYGLGNQGMDDSDLNIEQLRPLNMYAYSKHLFDLYAKKRGFLEDIIGLKYFNVFGPNEYHKGDMSSVILKAFNQIKKDGTVKLFKSFHPSYKDGEQKRDFLYIKDAVSMTLHLANSTKASGLYNIGSGTASTWNDLVNDIFEALDLTPNIQYIDMPEALQKKYQNYTCADISKLLETGYEGQISPLTQAVLDYVQNYLENDFAHLA